MLVILVGPKGSGKTTIGKVLGEAGAHIAFLEVEKIFLQVMRKCDSAVDNVFEKVHDSIDARILQLLSTHTTVIIESLGLGAPGEPMDKFWNITKSCLAKLSWSAFSVLWRSALIGVKNETKQIKCR